MFCWFTTARLGAGGWPGWWRWSGWRAAPHPGRCPTPAEDTLVTAAARPAQFLDDRFYSVLEDPSGHLPLHVVSGPAYAGRFATLAGTRLPRNNQHPRSTYWLRFTVQSPPAH
ncbi:MAG: hypothetical protein WKG07_32065 [Hymenobacter sp.]